MEKITKQKTRTMRELDAERHWCFLRSIGRKERITANKQISIVLKSRRYSVLGKKINIKKYNRFNRVV